MAEPLATTLAFILCYLAFAFLALCQTPHRKAVDPLATAPSPAGQLARKVLAMACIAVALFVLLAGHGRAFGALLLVMFASTAALAVSFTLSWKPRWLRLLSRALGGRRFTL